jgi:hypothetical protein
MHILFTIALLFVAGALLAYAKRHLSRLLYIILWFFASALTITAGWIFAF